MTTFSARVPIFIFIFISVLLLFPFVPDSVAWSGPSPRQDEDGDK